MAHFTLKLGSDGDILFDENGILEILEGDRATAQNVSNTLKAWKGEFILDETHGTDYDRILSQDTIDVSDGEAEEVYREAIFQEGRVSLIKNLEASIHNRTVDASFFAELSSGTEIEKEGAAVRVIGYE